MKAKKTMFKNSSADKYGKKQPVDQLQQSKSKVKYTYERTFEDIKNIDKVRKYLEINNHTYKSFKSDSKIYRELPNLFLNAVKDNQDQLVAIDELTAKMQDLEDLKDCFYRILELRKCVKTQKKPKGVE